MNKKELQTQYIKKYRNTLKGHSVNVLSHCKWMDKVAGRPQGDLTVEWIMKTIINGCAHKNECGTTDWREVGLNRLDNSLSHTKDNCEPCCKKCNDRLAAKEKAEKKAKQVDQIDLENGKIINTYTSIREAAEAVNGDKTIVRRCCNGGFFDKTRGKWHNSNSYKGYKWSYKPL